MEPDPSNPFREPETDSIPTIESPRLGIRHLMILTACAAAYLGMFRAIGQALRPDNLSAAMPTDEAAVRALFSVSGGAALAGLLLWAARRRRGMPFPVHPGEFLIIFLGIGVVLGLVQYTVFGWVFHPDSGCRFAIEWVLWCVRIPALLIQAAWWIWALIRLKQRRWRLFLVLMPVCFIAVWGTFTLAPVLTPIRNGIWTSLLSQTAGPCLVSIVLGIVVLRDHVKGLRYPWTHWLGILAYFWSAAAVTISNVWWGLHLPNAP